ncbi:hypothetical protein GGR54DRAFT_640591 [Hypoxylon sp. NC1633]|nr:hypothetical protein GGR54DRAFT_640591 [Hypoxylon sp. NC1633]
MAQQKPDQATLRIDSVIVVNTQTNSLNMAIKSTITSNGSTHATVDSFEGTIYLVDVNSPRAFPNINFPTTNSDAVQAVNINQEVRVSGQNAFAVFSRYVIQRESVGILVRGEIYIQVRGIPGTHAITFTKTVALAGLNGFEGLSVASPHALSLKIGNATFHNNTEVGTTYIQNLVLQPGPNALCIRADTNQTIVVDGLTQRPWCERNGTLTFQIAGENVVSHGQQLQYFANALAAANPNVNIPISQAVRNNIGHVVGCNNHLLPANVLR